MNFHATHVAMFYSQIVPAFVCYSSKHKRFKLRENLLLQVRACIYQSSLFN